MNLKQRIERMEKRFHSGIAATLTGWYESLDSSDPELRLGVDDKGQALIIAGRSGFLKQFMKAHRLTQRALADMIGAHRVTVADWVRGANKPRGLYLRALEKLVEQARRKER